MPRKGKRPSPRKYRRCPACDRVAAASAYKRAPGQPGLVGGAEMRVVCAGCGHVAPRWVFTEAKPPEGAGGPTPTQDRGNP